MQVRPLEDRGWFVVLAVGEEIVESLTDFAARAGIEAAQVSGLGAVRGATLGYFDPDSREYVRREFEEPLEIGNLVGNLGLVDGRPFLHAHVTLGARDCAAYTGHLFRGVIGVTGEFHVTLLPGTLSRRMDDSIGLNLIDLGPGEVGRR